MDLVEGEGGYDHLQIGDKSGPDQMMLLFPKASAGATSVWLFGNGKPAAMGIFQVTNDNDTEYHLYAKEIVSTRSRLSQSESSNGKNATLAVQVPGFLRN